MLLFKQKHTLLVVCRCTKFLFNSTHMLGSCNSILHITKPQIKRSDTKQVTGTSPTQRPKYTFGKRCLQHIISTAQTIICRLVFLYFFHLTWPWWSVTYMFFSKQFPTTRDFLYYICSSLMLFHESLASSVSIKHLSFPTHL